VKPIKIENIPQQLSPDLNIFWHDSIGWQNAIMIAAIANVRALKIFVVFLILIWIVQT